MRSVGGHSWQGREDLRLDERLMQTLRCANGLFRRSVPSAHRRLHVRTFAVVPLGPRTGLIEWVEHTSSLFGLYQAWQRHSLVAAGASALPVDLYHGMAFALQALSDHHIVPGHACLACGGRMPDHAERKHIKWKAPLTGTSGEGVAGPKGAGGAKLPTPTEAFYGRLIPALKVLPFFLVLQHCTRGLT